MQLNMILVCPLKKVPGISRHWIPKYCKLFGRGWTYDFRGISRDVSIPDCKTGVRIPGVASFHIVVGFWILRDVLWS